MFTFKLDSIKLEDNGSKAFFRKNDKADVQILSFITTDDQNLPSLTEYSYTNSLEEKQRIIKGAVEDVLSAKVLTEIENIPDDHIFHFGDTGMVLFSSDRIPDIFNWHFLLIGSKRKMRSNAEYLKGILSHGDYPEFEKKLIEILDLSSNASVSISIMIAKFLTQIVLDLHKRKKDKQLGIVYQSWSRWEDYPNGIREVKGIPDLTKNVEYDYSISFSTNVA